MRDRIENRPVLLIEVGYLLKRRWTRLTPATLEIVLLKLE